MKSKIANIPIDTWKSKLDEIIEIKYKVETAAIPTKNCMFSVMVLKIKVRYVSKAINKENEAKKYYLFPD